MPKIQRSPNCETGSGLGAGTSSSGVLPSDIAAAVFILFDTNVNKNESVKWARKGISRELATRHAEVRLINLRDDCGVNGVDDLLAAWGPARVLDLFDKSVAGATVRVALSPQFQSRPEGMFRVTTKGEQLIETPLTNYRAAIVTNVCLDDGVEKRREFELHCNLNGRLYQFTIPASRFAPMEWPIEQMGSSAITYTNQNQRDYARTAIQFQSLTAGERNVYTHSGWREISGNWVFLHAGGGIGEGGAVADVNVQLPGQMDRYRLALPKTKEELAEAVRMSLLLVEVGPPTITFPIVAAISRAVLGEADFAIHLVGETGTFKSELAALAQQFFGPGMDRLHPPGSWASTANALETTAFYSKDSIFVIDDFAPQGNAGDVARYHAAADRVFRAAGNGAGRHQLDASARLRESKAPRALIFSTGEDIPRGHSVSARLLILDISKGAIPSRKLADCQRAAAAGRYAQAMGGFL